MGSLEGLQSAAASGSCLAHCPFLWGLVSMVGGIPRGVCTCVRLIQFWKRSSSVWLNCLH